MSEFWEDKIKPHKDVVMAFIDPIVDAALANKRKGEKMEEEETLLEHLVALTDGKWRDHSFKSLLTSLKIL